MLQGYGADWLDGARSAVLEVPSALVPPEMNYVLNPENPDFERIEVGDPEPYDLDRRLAR